MNGNNREISGISGENLPAVKNERDALAIDMKLKGHSNQKIAEDTGMSLKTVQNVLSKGGRLYPVLETLRAEKLQAMRAGNSSAWGTLIEAKDPAAEELRRISREDPNSVARLKAIDMILTLTGVRDNERHPLLDPADPDESQERFINWADQLFLRVFRERAPKVTMVNRSHAVKMEEWLQAVLYLHSKSFVWEDSLDEEDFQRRMEAGGSNVQEMEELLTKVGFPSEPWYIYGINDEERLRAKEQTEKRRTKKKEILYGLEKYSAEYSRLLVVQYFQGQDEVLEKLRELWSSFQMSDTEAAKFLDGLKEERRKGWEENRKEELKWIASKENVFDEKGFLKIVEVVMPIEERTPREMLAFAEEIERRGKTWSEVTDKLMQIYPTWDANEALLFASDIRHYVTDPQSGEISDGSNDSRPLD